MKKEEIKFILLNMINEVKYEKDEEKIKYLDDSLLLRNDLNLDSFDLAILTAKIEDKYNIDVFEDGVVQTIGEIVNKLEKQ